LDTIQIRPVDESELPEAVRTSYRAFGTSPTQADHDYFRSDSERARTLCALDGDRYSRGLDGAVSRAVFARVRHVAPQEVLPGSPCFPRTRAGVSCGA